ncbi:MAG: hypothetical protein P8Y71_22445, partial [Pseudolabrys sp.]
AQAVQNDADFLFSRMALAGCPADVFHNPLRRRIGVPGFLSHLHSLMVTMSQKSSNPQAVKSVSQVLMLDTSPFKSNGQLTAENMALRHQVMVLRRQARGKIRLSLILIRLTERLGTVAIR